MSHPEELLADYADGALDQAQRAVVDAHLHTCERCRAELSLAARARTELRALSDEPVPFGVTGPVLAEAGGRFERRRDVMWQRLQWAAGLAAAAALVAVFAVNLGGTEPAQETTGAATEAASPEAPEAGAAAADALLGLAGVERQPGVTYDDAGIQAVALEASDAVASRAAGGTPGPPAGAEVVPADRALRCIARSGGPEPGPTETPIRLIEAEYEGTPAYIAVFAEGPGAGQAPDHVVVWVVGIDDCQILTTASQRIPPR